VSLCFSDCKQKKPPFSTKERRLIIQNKNAGQTYSTFVGVPYARTLNKFPIPARFSDLRFPKEPFPFPISNLKFEISKQWYAFFWPSNAHSGATVTAFNRVPFSEIIYFFSKEQA